MSCLTKRVGTLVIAAVATALIVAACGGSDPTAAPARVIVQTPTAAPTAAAEIIRQTATPVASGPTPTVQVIRQTATPTPTPSIGSITQQIKGHRPIQGPGLAGWRVPPQRGGTYVYGFPANNRGFDVTMSTSYTVSIAGTPATNSLMRCTPAVLVEVSDTGVCDAQGDIASSWTSSNGAKTWTFKIRDDVTWQNIPKDSSHYSSELTDLYGRKLVADDIVHAYKYWMGDLTKSDGEPQGTALGTKLFTSQVESVSAPDDTTVQVVLTEAEPNYFSRLADWRARLYAPEVFFLDGNHNKRVVGTGPMMLVEADPQVKLTFAANPNYWKTSPDGQPFPYLDGLTTQVVDVTLARAGLITGQIDSHNGSGGVGTPSGAVNFGRQCQECQLAETTLAWTNFSLGFSTTNEINGYAPRFTDRRARLAIAKAIDWQEIIDSVWEGAATINTVSAAWGYFFDQFPSLKEFGNNLPDDDNPWVFDPDLAKELWAAAGRSPGEKHQILYNEYTPTQTNNAVAVGDQIARNLDIEVEVYKVPDVGIYYTATGFINENFQNFESMVQYVHGPTIIPSDSVAQFNKGGHRNQANIDSPIFDALAKEWRLEDDPEKLRELGRQWHTEVVNQLKWLPMPTPLSYLITSERSRNVYEFRAAGIQFFHGGWHIEYVWKTA